MASSAHASREPVARGLRLGRILGIEIRADPSVLIIFVLVVVSLAMGPFAEWHPGWSAALRWGTALGAGVLFFASLLAHELAHSVVAKAYGIPVPRITLFLLGGLSEMDGEAKRPSEEFFVAIVGPLMSLALGIGFWLLAGVLAGADLAVGSAEELQDAISRLGPVVTLLLWLGPINILLAFFNLIPGFPLDGGRVFRSIAWAITKDVEKATRWASNLGRGVAWLLMGLGVVQVLTGAFQGLWLLLIGWFLNNAAQASYQQTLIRTRLGQYRVSDLMRTDFGVVDAATPLGAFVEKQLLRGAQQTWPVISEGQAVGMVDIANIRRSRSKNGETVADAMQPMDEPIGRDAEGTEALRRLARARREAVPVVDEGELVGLLHRDDIVRWMALEPHAS